MPTPRKIPADMFCDIWNNSKNTEEARCRTGYKSISVVKTIAVGLRRRKYNLKFFCGHKYSSSEEAKKAKRLQKSNGMTTERAKGMQKLSGLLKATERIVMEEAESRRKTNGVV